MYFLFTEACIMAMNIKEGIITESELVQSFGSPSQKNLLLKTNS